MREFPGMADVTQQTQVSESLCRKDIGEKRKLRLWSRGHVAIHCQVLWFHRYAEAYIQV